MKEIIDVYDINGKHLGARTRAFCHGKNPGVYHKSVLIWIKNYKGQILVQKRAMSKKNNPGKWDMSTAGHIDAGETLLQACVRETYEELGIKARQKDFVFLREWLNQDGYEFAETYILKTNKDIKDMKLQKKEVECVKWLDYGEFVKLFYSPDFCSYPKEFRDWSVQVLK